MNGRAIAPCKVHGQSGLRKQSVCPRLKAMLLHAMCVQAVAGLLDQDDVTAPGDNVSDTALAGLGGLAEGQQPSQARLAPKPHYKVGLSCHC